MALLEEAEAAQASTALHIAAAQAPQGKAMRAEAFRATIAAATAAEAAEAEAQAGLALKAEAAPMTTAEGPALTFQFQARQ